MSAIPEMMTHTTACNLARKFEFLREKISNTSQYQGISAQSASNVKATVHNLKEFYLDRFSKRHPEVDACMGAQATHYSGSNTGQLGASGQQFAYRPFFVAVAGVVKAAKGAYGNVAHAATPTLQQGYNDFRGKSLEIMRNVHFMPVPTTEAFAYGPLCCRDRGRNNARKGEPLSPPDVVLHKLRSALETRLENSALTATVLHHLAELRYHIDAALTWVPGSPAVGVHSKHTVEGAKGLARSARVLAPAVYMISKRIASALCAKQREMLREHVAGEYTAGRSDDARHVRAGGVELVKGVRPQTIVGARSFVSEMRSNCASAQSDVGNLSDADEYLKVKDEEQQRKWFYSRCLTAKFACSDMSAKKLLVSDLYTQVRAEELPTRKWQSWIRGQHGLTKCCFQPEEYCRV